MGFGTYGLYQLGKLQYIFEVDQSGISIIILAIFAMVTSWIGWLTYKANKGTPATTGQVDDLYQYSDFMTVLGLIGTVIGLIIIMGPAFADIDVSDPITIEMAIKIIGSGIGTALVTTLVGSVCSLLAKLQIINFDGKS